MDKSSLPAGLAIGKRGEYLEKSTSKSGVLKLLVSHAGQEIVEGTLRRNERLTLVPPESGADAVVESCYILDGALELDLPEGNLFFSPGDYIVASNLASPAIFTAKVKTRFLYTTSQPFFHEISKNLNDLMRLSHEIELKDGYSGDHCLRLQKLSYATGRTLGLEPHRLHLLDYGSYLHDLGKVRIPIEILSKPAPLSDDEWEIVKRHPIYGRELLEPTFMREAGVIVEQHHEKLDGSGYPYGLAANAVLTSSYIVGVADAFDAMTSVRPYRQALDAATALGEIEKLAGVHYPKEVVEAFLSVMKGPTGAELSRKNPVMVPVAELG